MVVQQLDWARSVNWRIQRIYDFRAAVQHVVSDWLTRRVLASHIRFFPALVAWFLGASVSAAVLVLMIGVLGGLPSLATAIYWYNGGSAYLTSLTLLLLFIYCFVQRYVTHPWLLTVLTLVLTFAIWLDCETTGFIQLLILVFWATGLFASRSPGSRKPLRHIRISLAGCVIGLIYTFLSPGNKVRLAMANPQHVLGYAFGLAISVPGAPFSAALLASPWTTLALLILPARVAYTDPESISRVQRDRARQFIFLGFLAWVVGSAATFGALGYSAAVPFPVHTWILPNGLFFCGLMIWGFAWGLALKPLKPAFPPSGWLRGAVLVILILTGVVGIKNAVNGFTAQKNYAEAWDRRDKAIWEAIVVHQAPLDHSVFIHPFAPIQPDYDPSVAPLKVDSLRLISPFRWEANDRPAEYPNTCIARYYGVAGIVGVPNK